MRDMRTFEKTTECSTGTMVLGKIGLSPDQSLNRLEPQILKLVQYVSTSLHALLIYIIQGAFPFHTLILNSNFTIRIRRDPAHRALIYVA